MSKKISYKTEKLVISLIKDDLINLRLVHGLNALGLDAENYYTNLSSTIFGLMGLQTYDERMVKILESYIDSGKRVLRIDIEDHRDEFDELAVDIYDSLVSLKKLYRL